MHVVLDPAHDAAHGDWLRRTPGAYEWWYFDAVSDDAAWALTCIWFLGNPFSPYYRLAALGQSVDPFTHNALFFALYHHGGLHAYHFTRLPRAQICADEARPATLRFGPSDLGFHDGVYILRLSDENANRRVLNAQLSFTSPAQISPPPPELGVGGPPTGPAHFWLPAAPACQVAVRISLQEPVNPGGERIAFAGHGYHDHNWGTLPFAADIRDWYWARIALGPARALIIYHVDYHDGRRPSSHLLLFEHGWLTHYDPQAQVRQHRPRLNGFGTLYASQLEVLSDEISAAITLGSRLDSAPFYIRTLCRADVSLGGRNETGTGIAEYFRPQGMESRLAASAMKARIVAP